MKKRRLKSLIGFTLLGVGLFIINLYLFVDVLKVHNQSQWDHCFSHSTTGRTIKVNAVRKKNIYFYGLKSGHFQYWQCAKPDKIQGFASTVMGVGPPEINEIILDANGQFSWKIKRKSSE